MLRNMGVLVLIALPAGVASLVPNEWWLTGDTGVSSIADVLTAFLVAVLPIAAGGALHQWLAARLPASWRPRNRRLVVIASSPLVTLGLPVFVELSYLVRLALPLLVGLVVYNGLAKIMPGE